MRGFTGIAHGRARLVRPDPGRAARASIRSTSARARRRSSYFRQFPSPTAGRRLPGQHRRLPLRARRSRTQFRTYIARARLSPERQPRTSSAASTSRTTPSRTSPQYPGQAAANRDTDARTGASALGWDSTLGQNMVNTFRYGYTRDRHRHARPAERDITAASASSTTVRRADRHQQRPQHRDAQLRQRLLVVKGRHTLKFGGNLRWIRNDNYNNTNSFHDRHRRTVVGAGRRPALHARRRLPGAGGLQRPAGGGGQRRGRPTPIRSSTARHLSQTNAIYNYTIDGAAARRSARRCTRLYGANEFELYVQDSWQRARQPDGERRPPLQPLSRRRGKSTASRWRRRVNLGDWFDQRAANMRARHSVERERAHHVRARRPGQRRARLLRRGTRTTSRRASRRRGRRRRRWSCAAATASSTTASAPASPRRSTTAARSACRPTLNSPFGTVQRADDPAVRFTGINVDPGDLLRTRRRPASRRRRRSAPA